jgi:hypothetical protein
VRIRRGDPKAAVTPLEAIAMRLKLEAASFKGGGERFHAAAMVLKVETACFKAGAPR